MSDQLKAAMERKLRLQAELALVEQYISLHVKLFGEAGQNPPVSVDNDRPTASGPGPKAVAQAAEAILREASAPIKRGKLIEAIEATGLTITAKDKSKYIGTILWRNADRFTNIEGEGYWLKDRPLPASDDFQNLLR